MLIERDDELKRLDDLLSLAEKSRGSIAQITGEAGIGKTSLISEFFSQTKGRAVTVWGMCDALFTPRPLGPIYDIAHNLSKKCSQLATTKSDGEVLFPVMYDTMMASSSPIILVIEDIHWADYGTLDFLRFLGRRISLLPVLLIVSYRDDEIGRDHPLIQVIGDLPAANIHRFGLSPLSLEGVEKLNVDRGVPTGEILRVTGGNPFFVTELIASSDTKIDTAPTSVREAVNARLSRISPSERNFLEAASAIPGSIEISLLDPLFNNEAEVLVLACIQRGLLKRDGDGSLRFRHELARLATAGRMTFVEQKKIHEHFLKQLIDQKNPPLDQLVHHASGALATGSVLKYAPIAAEAAAEIGSHREAAAHYATALEFVSDAEPEQAATLYENWAYEAGLALKIDDEVIDARKHAITIWRALGRRDKVGANLRWLSRLHWYRGEAAKATRYSDEAVQILENEGPSKEKAMAYSLRSQLHMLNDRMLEAIEWGEKAIAMASDFDDDEVIVHALNNIGTAKLFRGNKEGLTDMEECLRLARKNTLHEEVARVYTNLAEYAVEFKDFTLAENMLSEGITFSQENDLDSWTYYLVGRLAQLRFEQGRIQDAQTIAEGVLARHNQTLLMKLPALLVYAKVKIRLGASDARKHLTEALRGALATGELQYIIPARIAFVEAAARTGVTPDAKEHFEQIVAHKTDEILIWRWAELWFWARQCGLKVPDEHIKVLPVSYQHVADGDPFVAATVFADLGMAYHQAQCLMLTGDDKDLIAAHRLFMQMGASGDQRIARQKAIQRGIASQLTRKQRGPYAASKSHPLGLTRREQDVLQELVTGATNQEIAKALSRSSRTVENHVSTILQKFNVSNRTEIILRVQNEPWLVPQRQSSL